MGRSMAQLPNRGAEEQKKKKSRRRQGAPETLHLSGLLDVTARPLT